MERLLRKGGIKLKLIGFMIITIIIAVGILSFAITTISKKSLAQKALEVAQTTIERTSEASIHALLEKTDETKLNLYELIENLKKSNIDGVVDISLFARSKSNNVNRVYEYFAGFGHYKMGQLIDDPSLLETFNDAIFRQLKYKDAHFNIEEKQFETFMFIEPIYYKFQGKDILLGISVLHYDKNVINRVTNEIIKLSVIITFSIVIIMAILVYFLGNHFSKPIIQITNAATKVKEGDLDIKLNITSNDELQTLSIEFNSMVKGLKEKFHMEKYVSKDTADMIASNQSNLVLGGSYQKMTFLFSDIRGFTSMSENKKPEEVVEIVNFYLNLQSNIIKENGGDIDKFVGDEVMATFSGPNSIKRAIQASIDIQKVIHKENIKRASENKSSCRVGIGINDGEVIVGNMGANDRMDYTSIGAAVNLAARLCSNANAGEVLISEESYCKGGEQFKSQKLEPILVKGIEEPIEIFSIEIKG